MLFRSPTVLRPHRGRGEDPVRDAGKQDAAPAGGAPAEAPVLLDGPLRGGGRRGRGATRATLTAGGEGSTRAAAAARANSRARALLLTSEVSLRRVQDPSLV